MATRKPHRFPWKWNLADLPEPESGAPTVLSTFACGGGSTMGYKLAGFRTLGYVEIDPRIAAVYDANLHPAHRYVEDIREFNARSDIPNELYDLDVLDGSPPCSTFSTAGRREDAWGVEKVFAEGQANQRLDDLFFVYLDTVEKLRPKVSVAENVTGLLRGNARGYVNEIIRRYHEIGYEVQMFKLDASKMGVPQKRERVFFVANRMGYPKLALRFDEPEITFGEVRTDAPGCPISDLKRRYFDLRKPGENCLASVVERIEGKRRMFNYMISDDHRASMTIPATTRLIRGCDGTHLTDRDVINASTFPQDYDFCDQSTCFICGMSVPPVMMAQVASEVRRQWLA